METYGRFLFEFLHQFFSGFGEIFGGLWKGILNIFNIPEYYYIIQNYANDFKVSEWFLTGLAIICMIIVVGSIIGIIVFFLKRHMKWRKKIINQEELLKQIDTLNDQVEELVDEKLKLLSMKSPELGVNPNGIGVGPTNRALAAAAESQANDEEQIDPNTQSRFSKLILIDQEYAKYKQKDYGNTFELPEFCYRFRNFAASKLKLYYSEKMIRLFVSAIASTKLVILSLIHI